MSIEENFDRLATNVALLTGAIATLAEAVNGGYAGKPIYAEGAAALPATPKPRGRPPKAVDASTPAASTGTVPATSATAGALTTLGSASPATTTAAAFDADPFATPTETVQAPTATLDEVRAALTALKTATTQEKAVAVLKEASGVDNLGDLQKTPAKYGGVVKAAKAAIPVAAAVDESDPFGEKTAAAVVVADPAQKAPSLEDVKAAVVAAQKRTGQAIVQKVVVDLGGKSATTGGPSLKDLPVPKYAEVIAALAALPTTK